MESLENFAVSKFLNFETTAWFLGSKLMALCQELLWQLRTEHRPKKLRVCALAWIWLCVILSSPGLHHS